jgi:hypothetical protein
MKKHLQYFLVLFIIIFVYNALSIIFHNETFIEIWGREKRFVSVDYLQWILSVLPWYALICFGCYCLSKLGSDILTFNDCPKEIEKLTQVNELIVI